MLVQHLKTINPIIETGVLLSHLKTKTKKVSKQNVKSSSKSLPPIVVKESKKHEFSEPAPIIAKKLEVTQPEATVLPSKSGVLKKLKKKARKSSPTYTVKPEVTRKVVIFREVQDPVSPISNKQRAEDMAKHFMRNQKQKLRKLVINDESTKEEDTPESLVLDYPITSNVETSDPIPTSVVYKKASTPRQILITTPPVSIVETSQDQGTFYLVVSSTFDNSTLDTSNSLPTFFVL
ncbi:unnamed protein product [Lactuca saligna]|uniref:Uncharacterized protein n=1 Tax=Lactuca saligna TaxID=75948 RepID=A0AA36ES06_LACSI|nr:unnamed protein product [Lactuca saligna]